MKFNLCKLVGEDRKIIATIVYAVLDIASIMLGIIVLPALAIVLLIFRPEGPEEINHLGHSIFIVLVAFGILSVGGRIIAALYLLPKLTVFVRVYNNTHYVFAMWLFLTLVQWVLNPENPVHEPRAALLAFIVGLMEYIRRRSHIPEDPKTKLFKVPENVEA